MIPFKEMTPTKRYKIKKKDTLSRLAIIEQENLLSLEQEDEYFEKYTIKLLAELDAEGAGNMPKRDSTGNVIKPKKNFKGWR